MFSYFRIILTIILALSLVKLGGVVYAESTSNWWDVQSVDTMKYSRDKAREKSGDASYDVKIDNLLARIAGTGATHVAIATPYDEEFIPFMRRWLTYARKHKLGVWFRGNFAGWEGWFEYSKMTKEEHLRKTQAFIQNHPDLFEDGDIFTSCPECENGALGDPRMTGRVDEFKMFLKDSDEVTVESFKIIGKKVITNYYSMNGDVAKLIMTPTYSKELGSVVVIDHYVESPEQLDSDISEIAELSGSKIVLGEFGAPIPDIHGDMSGREQADWLEKTMSLIIKNPNVIGVNYWTSEGSSTAIWEDSGAERSSVGVLTKYFTPNEAEIIFLNDLVRGISGVKLVVSNHEYTSDSKGSMKIKYFDKSEKVIATHPKYKDFRIDLSVVTTDKVNEANMLRSHPTIFDSIKRVLHDLFSTFSINF